MTYTWELSQNHNRISSSSQNVLILLSLLLSRSYAQDPTNTLRPTPTASTSTGIDSGFSSTSGLQSSIFTSFTSSSSLNSTLSSVTSRRTADTRPPLFESSNSGPQYNASFQKEKAFNYYFLILAAFGVAVAIGLWLVRRRKRRQKEQMRLRGQNALARDLEGWSNSRRWMHGTWRHNHTSALVRREEGLNEHGEAPPPYHPKNNITTVHNSSGGAPDAMAGLTAPLRTLSRDEAELPRPPAYQESTSNQSHIDIHPNAFGTHTIRSE